MSTGEGTGAPVCTGVLVEGAACLTALQGVRVSCTTQVKSPQNHFISADVQHCTGCSQTKLQ